MTTKAYRYRFYPTEAQRHQLETEFGQARWVWNWALDMRKKAYLRRNEHLSYVDISRVLTRLKATARYQWLKAATAACHTQKLRDLDRAFANFYAGRGGHPKFKAKRGRQSVRYQLDLRRSPAAFLPGKRLVIPKLGPVRLRWSRLPQGVPKMATVSQDAAGRYFVTIAVVEEIDALPSVPASVGVDMGLADAVVTSDGWKSGSPRFRRKVERLMRREQRRLSRKKPWSKRRRHQRQRLARLHAKTSDRRLDFLHKLSRKLVNENQVIAIEDLHVRGLAKSHMAKSIGDAGLGELRRQIEYKAAWYGRRVVVVDRYSPTSKTCSGCGFKLPELSLGAREWDCPGCGAHHDRDVNAAANILCTAGGVGINARGEQIAGGRGARDPGVTR